MADGFKVLFHGVATHNLFPSLSIDNVLYVLHWTYPLVFSLVLLIVLFLLPKILFVCKIDFVSSSDELVDIFTKFLNRLITYYICNKFDTYNLYVPAWERMLDIVKILLDFVS